MNWFWRILLSADVLFVIFMVWCWYQDSKNSSGINDMESSMEATAGFFEIAAAIVVNVIAIVLYLVLHWIFKR